MRRISRRGGDFIRQVPVEHPTADSLKACRTWIPRGTPNPDGNVWVAAAMQYQTTTGFCVNLCRDRIPSNGWLQVTPRT